MGKVQDTPRKTKTRQMCKTATRNEPQVTKSPHHDLASTPVSKIRSRISTSTPIGKYGDDVVLNNLLEKEFDFYCQHDAGVDIVWDCNSPDAIKTILRSQMQKGLLGDISMRLNLDDDDDPRVLSKTPQSVRKSSRIAKKHRAKKSDNSNLESFKMILQSMASDILCSPDATPTRLDSHDAPLVEDGLYRSCDCDETRSPDAPRIRGGGHTRMSSKLQSDSNSFLVDQESDKKDEENGIKDEPNLVDTSVWSDDDLFANDSFLIKATQCVGDTGASRCAITPSAVTPSGTGNDGYQGRTDKATADSSNAANKPVTINNSVPLPVSTTRGIYTRCTMTANPSVTCGTTTDKARGGSTASSLRCADFKMDQTKMDSRGDLEHNFIGNKQKLEVNNSANSARFFPRHSSFGTPNCMRSLSQEYNASDCGTLDKSLKRHKSDLSWQKPMKADQHDLVKSNEQKFRSSGNSNIVGSSNLITNVSKSNQNHTKNRKVIGIVNPNCVLKEIVSKDNVKYDTILKLDMNQASKIKDKDAIPGKGTSSFCDLNASFNTSLNDDIFQLIDSDDMVGTGKLVSDHQCRNTEDGLNKERPTVSAFVASNHSVSNIAVSSTVSGGNQCTSSHSSITPISSSTASAFIKTTSSVNSFQSCNNQKSNLQHPMNTIATSGSCNFLGFNKNEKKVPPFTNLRPKQDTQKSRYQFRRTVTNHSISLPATRHSKTGYHGECGSQRHPLCSANQIEQKKRLAQEKLEQKKHLEMQKQSHLLQR